jgi:hypothetical protein
LQLSCCPLTPPRPDPAPCPAPQLPTEPPAQARHLTVLVARLQTRPGEDVLWELAACAAGLGQEAWDGGFSKVRAGALVWHREAGCRVCACSGEGHAHCKLLAFRHRARAAPRAPPAPGAARRPGGHQARIRGRPGGRVRPASRARVPPRSAVWARAGRRRAAATPGLRRRVARGTRGRRAMRGAAPRPLGPQPRSRPTPRAPLAQPASHSLAPSTPQTPRSSWRPTRRSRRSSTPRRRARCWRRCSSSCPARRRCRSAAPAGLRAPGLGLAVASPSQLLPRAPAARPLSSAHPHSHPAPCTPSSPAPSGTAVDGDVLCAAIRCVQRAAVRLPPGDLMAAAPGPLLGGLFAAFQHPRPDVRKVVVFCIVDMWMHAGDRWAVARIGPGDGDNHSDARPQPRCAAPVPTCTPPLVRRLTSPPFATPPPRSLTPYLSTLSASQLKLLTIYYTRARDTLAAQQRHAAQ